MRSPYAGRKPRNPFNKQVLGVLVRQAEREPTPLNMTLARRKLMEAISRAEVKAGQGQYTGGYRLHGETVTGRTQLLINAGWAKGGKVVELTEAGREALAKPSNEEETK